MTFASAITIAAVTLGTWTGDWFPSGRAEHRDTPENEARVIASAGRMLAEGLKKADPTGTNDVILCLSEIRDAEAAEALIKAIGMTNLHLAVISGYRRRDRLDMQQDLIATTLPVADASWSAWKNSGLTTPPRGSAHANLVFSPAVTATVYAVQLKSSYGQTTEADAIDNRGKRGAAIRQLVEQEKPRNGVYRSPVVIAGSFNADKWDYRFREETIFQQLNDERFVNVIEYLPAEDRSGIRKGKWKGAVFDYIFVRGISAAQPMKTSSWGISGHDAIFTTLYAEGGAASAKAQAAGRQSGVGQNGDQQYGGQQSNGQQFGNSQNENSQKQKRKRSRKPPKGEPSNDQQ